MWTDIDRKMTLDSKAQIFHCLVSQLLFLCTRVWQDIFTAVVFLSTRLKHPNEDECWKIFQDIRYLKGTPSLPLALEAGGLNMIHWWYEARENMTHGSIYILLGTVKFGYQELSSSFCPSNKSFIFNYHPNHSFQIVAWPWHNSNTKYMIFQ